MEDRRRYQRFTLEDSILLKFESNPEKAIEGKLLDISFGGLNIFLNESINLGTVVQAIVQFNYSYSTEKQLIGRGRVVHAAQYKLHTQDGFRIGLEFIEIEREIVINIIDNLRTKILHQIRSKGKI